MILPSQSTINHPNILIQTLITSLKELNKRDLTLTNNGFLATA